jgi:putative ABC transport system substrate-binding protein
MSNTSETERAIAAFAAQPNGGLIVTGSALTATYRELINSLAAKYKLPAVASNRIYVTRGVLISYGVDFVDQNRRAAAYVDRILKGEKPADLPVQALTKYDQPQTREGTGAHRAAVAACPRRRGDRIGPIVVVVAPRF